MLDETHPAHAQELRRLADEAIRSNPDSREAIDMALDILLADGVIPPSVAGEGAYTVLDGAAYDLDVDTETGEIGACTCAWYTDGNTICRHRAAVRLFLRSQAALRQWVSDSPPVTYPEMPYSFNVFLTIRGHRVQATIRGFEEAETMTRLERVLERYPAEGPSAPQATVSTPTDEPAPALAPPAPVEEPADSAPREDYCAIHQVQMRHNERGWSHKVEDGIWCEGHWCPDHQVRFWKNTSRRDGSTYYSHKKEDGSGTCYEKKART